MYIYILLRRNVYIFLWEVAPYNFSKWMKDIFGCIFSIDSAFWPGVVVSMYPSQIARPMATLFGSTLLGVDVGCTQVPGAMRFQWE